MERKNRIKGGRPMVGDAHYKEHIVSTRLDAAGHLKLEQLVKKSGKSAADVIRELIFNGWIKERMRREYLDFMAQFKGIARNLNQLTKLANGAGFRNVQIRHEAIITEIENFLKRLRDDR